ncbi:hypothetical protein KBI5_04760 [Frankia sp. KB5]|nr:hypothetical protein KBI5_04760 [Frankia sp. KB5]
MDVPIQHAIAGYLEAGHPSAACPTRPSGSPPYRLEPHPTWTFTRMLDNQITAIGSGRRVSFPVR